MTLSRSNNEVQWYLARRGITDIDPESISFKVEGPATNRLKRDDWREEGRGNLGSATNLGGAKKRDEDINVLLEDSDDEWIPGMLKN